MKACKGCKYLSTKEVANGFNAYICTRHNNEYTIFVGECELRKEVRNRMSKEEALEALDRIYNYCEEIDCHLPKEERTGYVMYGDYRALKNYILGDTE